MNVVIPAFEGALPTSVIGPYDMFTKASAIHRQITGDFDAEPFFNVNIVSAEGQVVKGSGDYPFFATAQLHDTEDADLVVVPAPGPEYLPELDRVASTWLSWLPEQYGRGAEISSICLGAFLLARTGLLDGKRATTHWIGADMFREQYPQVTLLDDKIIVDEGRIYTCGGASSFQNLVIYLVEKFAGRPTAVTLAKMFLVDPNKGSQHTYAIFGIQKHHTNTSILSAQEYIELNAVRKLSVDEIASEVAMSKRTFVRKFKAVTGNTPKEYMQRARVEAAKKRLEMQDDTVEILSREVGYDDVGAFRKLFKKYTGSTPVEYRKRYTMRVG